MPFSNNNVNAGLPSSSQTQIGRSDADQGNLAEQGVTLPWLSDPSASWLYFECTIGVKLDSGIAVHNRLPQVNKVADTLGAQNCYLDNPNIDTLTPQYGVNLKCNDQYQDIVQRMGHSRYWFRLWGRALRMGRQVPIPQIKTIGGVQAIPYDKNPQWAFNHIFPGGNYGGTILWHAEWSLWYTTAQPPTSSVIPAADLAAHISSATTLPTTIQVPYSSPDDNAVVSIPPSTQGKTPNVTATPAGFGNIKQ